MRQTMNATRRLLPILACAMAVLAASCLRTHRWDASTNPGLCGIMGRTYELLVPCYVVRTANGAGLVPPGSWQTGNLPSENMEGHAGRRLGIFKVLGVVPAGMRFTITRACWAENLANRYLAVFAETPAYDRELEVNYLLDWDRPRTPVLSPIAYYRPRPECIREVTAEGGRSLGLTRYLPHASKWKRKVR